MSVDRLEALALRLRGEHPDVDPLELDIEQATELLAAAGSEPGEVAGVLVAWERLIP